MVLPQTATRQFAMTILVPVQRERLKMIRMALDKVRAQTIVLMGGEPLTDEELREAQLTEPLGDKPSMAFDQMKTIHYARWILIDRTRGFISGPQLVLSTNYDGPVGKSECSEEEARERHIKELVEYGHEALHDIYSCCKEYDLEEDASTDDKKEYLESYLTRPEHLYPASTFYRGTSGRSRDQVLGEAELRRQVDTAIDTMLQQGDWPPGDQSQMRRDIRDALDEPPPPFPPQPTVVKNWKFVLILLLWFVGVALAMHFWRGDRWWLAWAIVGAAGVVTWATMKALSLALYWPTMRFLYGYMIVLPGVFAYLLYDSSTLREAQPWQYWAISAVVILLLLTQVVRTNRVLEKINKSSSLGSLLVTFLLVTALYVPVLTQLASSPDWWPEEAMSPEEFSHGYMIILVAVSTPILLFGLVMSLAFRRLETLEANDPEFDPAFNEAELQHIAWSTIDENRFFQNQLSNIAVLKPGGFRSFLITAVFYVLQILATTVFNKGQLGGIPTIHFARWVKIDNGRRVLFMSNFDSSWESYLGDFIDKASSGLTGVWSNTVGYPSTQYLVFAGSRAADRFKSWARHQQIRTHVWYSAYPGLSVRNINDNTIIRRGLASIQDVSNEQWLRALHGRQSS